MVADDGSPVQSAYVICASPRSGSTLLCRGLEATGRAGAPAEYFDRRPEVLRYWHHRLGARPQATYADTIIAATSTPNGVFGAKTHWTTFGDMRELLSEGAAPHRHVAEIESVDALLRARFPTVRYIWLSRRNKVAQAISHYRAARSGVWEIVTEEDRGERRRSDLVRFDHDAIAHCVALAWAYDRGWQRYFAANRLAPMRIWYEDLVSTYDVTIRRVLTNLELPHTDLPPIEPSLARLADAKSAAWEAQFRATAATISRRKTAASLS
jgi:LPS sulfotransferase NodH